MEYSWNKGLLKQRVFQLAYQTKSIPAGLSNKEYSSWLIKQRVIQLAYQTKSKPAGLSKTRVFFIETYFQMNYISCASAYFKHNDPNIIPTQSLLYVISV